MNSTNVPAAIDPQTGEVMLPDSVDQQDIIRPESPVEALLASIRGESQLPLHLAMIEKLGLTPEQLELVLSAYAQEPLSFKKVAGKSYPVHGMVIFQHGPYNGMDGQFHPEGFYQVKILVEIKEELQVLKSSSPSLMEVVASIIAHRGGGLFKEPIIYEFALGEDNVHRIYNKSLLLKPELLRRKAP